MTAVKVPANLQAALTDYPQCDKQTWRTPEHTERCAKPSEWGVRCIHCGAVALLCEEHGAFVASRQKPQACSACNTVGLVPLRWTFYRLRCTS